MSARNIMKRSLIFILPCMLSFLLGAGTSKTMGALDAKSEGPYKKLDIFSMVLSFVLNGYVDNVENEALVNGAIKGMLGTLDPHTMYLTAHEYAEMKVDTSGEFAGLGIEIEERGGQYIVISPIEDTPAARAGIQKGDRIIKIDGEPTGGMRFQDVVAKLRGKKGTKVVLTIMREGFEEPRDFTLVRSHIKIKSVEARTIEPGYGYARVKSFQNRTERYLRKEIERLLDENGGSLRGLVLDMRNNPGGLLDEAVKVADDFLDKGLIVYTEGRNKTHVKKEMAHSKMTFPVFPMVVLVNSGTASASEIVAGALQDHGRALILGTRSFGKGSVQTIIEMPDMSALKLTIARYYTPNGRSIQEEGIKPDVEVPATEQASPSVETEIVREVNLSRHLKGEGGQGKHELSVELSLDHQIRTALDYLKGLNILKSSMKEAGEGAQGK